MIMAQTFRELVVWQRSVAWATEVYRATAQFPKEETYGLSNQLRRAVVSISSNIAEGHGRLNNAEFRQFLAIARGSLREAETQLEIARNLSYLSKDKLDHLLHEGEQLGRMLSAFITSITQDSPKTTKKTRSSQLAARSPHLN
jgi:four helix bundle protein